MDEGSEIFIEASRKLEKSGADAIVICANSPHHIADIVQNEIGIPIFTHSGSLVFYINYIGPLQGSIDSRDVKVDITRGEVL